MTSAGLAVPPGFVVTAEAYRFFMRENGLEATVSDLLADAGSDSVRLDAAAKDIRDGIMRGSLPGTLSHEILAAYEKLGPEVRVAVRSSATA